MKHIVAVGCAVAVLFVACGGGGNDGATATRPAAATAVARPSSTPDPSQQTDGNGPGIPELRGQIVTTASGLRYIEEKVGDGATPQSGQSVTVHYTGWLVNGTQFDSSRTRNQPYVFPLGRSRVIRGWDEGVATMKVGGKRRLIVPAGLAYGPQQRGSIPPNSTLIFDVELLAVQ